MKKVSTLQLVPGMVLAESVFSYDSQLILAKDTVLSDNLISRLDLYGVFTVNITDESATDLPSLNDIKIPVEELSYSKRIKGSPEFRAFRKYYETNVHHFRTAINRIVTENFKVDINALLQHSLNMIAADKGPYGILDLLHNMREYDDTTYAHSMNVALICNVFASWLKMGEEETELVTICGLLHDIGKLMVPQDIILKPAKLSDEEFMQIRKHPYSGYKILQSQDVDEHIRNAALMHHERNDGTGYPLHLKGDKIDRYASIVAIADVYDAMTAARVYRGPLCPFRLIEIFEEEGLQKYNVELILIFMENVANTYLGNRCRLSDGREGDIIFINRDRLSRPIVQCGKEYVNLFEQPQLYIDCLI